MKGVGFSTSRLIVKKPLEIMILFNSVMAKMIVSWRRRRKRSVMDGDFAVLI